MSWTTNTIMEWSDDGGNTWTKITDHGRSELSVDVEPIETKSRMANGTMRKYVVAKKRTFSWSYENLPDKDTSFLANGDTYGKWFEEFYNSTDGPFLMRLREGSDQGVTISRTGDEGDPDTERVFTVMFSEFSKSVSKRGTSFDLWNLSLALEEV